MGCNSSRTRRQISACIAEQEPAAPRTGFPGRPRQPARLVAQVHHRQTGLELTPISPVSCCWTHLGWLCGDVRRCSSGPHTRKINQAKVLSEVRAFSTRGGETGSSDRDLLNQARDGDERALTGKGADLRPLGGQFFLICWEDPDPAPT